MMKVSDADIIRDVIAKSASSLHRGHRHRKGCGPACPASWLGLPCGHLFPERWQKGARRAHCSKAEPLTTLRA